MYKVGEEITTHYIDCPLPPDKQYKLEDEIKIFEMDTRQTLATFIVTHTDPYIAKGIINWVNGTS